MRLPDWFPEVSRPLNPSWGETWDKMSRSDRQWSLFIDLAVVAVVLVLAWSFS